MTIIKLINRLVSLVMMKNKALEEVRCNLCLSNNFDVLIPAKYDLEKDTDVVKKFRSSGDEKLIDQLVKCKDCGLIYVNPRIKGNLIIDAYSEGTDENFVSQAKWREITFAKGMNDIEKYHPRKGRILDIGTAGGSFLHVAKQRGWDVFGVEPNKWLCKWGKKHYGIDIKPGDIFANKFKDRFFDAVTLWDVLEHTPNPYEVLEECNRIMKKGGLLLVNYPDIGSPVARAMKDKWIFLLSVHLYYFDKKTITKILNENGFEVVKIKPHIQKLSFGYLMFRMKEYNQALGGFGSTVANTLGLQNMQIPYWLGQTLVIARKK